jgi:oxygen-independent coproporphyrinogen-3 oxidase
MVEVPISAPNARNCVKKERLKKSKAGLYIHVPFCRSKCPYCDFYSIPFDEELKNSYLKALKQEIIISAKDKPGLKADTLYFGGGTPSLLKPNEVGQIINLCRKHFSLSDSAEISLEANPESLNLKKLRSYYSVGINRLSLGFQSLNDEELNIIGRLHNASKAIHAYSQACKAGFDNISIDLMMGIPQQTLERWEYTLNQIVQLKPQHISTYILEIKEGSLWSKRPLEKHASEEAVSKMYYFTLDFLSSNGYQQYEISNFSLPGFCSYHNYKYWSGYTYLGFGPSAHSLYNNYRYDNVSDLNQYIERIKNVGSARDKRIFLTKNNRLEEILFLGLRKTEGVELKLFQVEFGIDILSKFSQEISRLQDAGLVEISKGFFKLSRKGLLLSNEVFQAFLLD